MASNGSASASASSRFYRHRNSPPSDRFLNPYSIDTSSKLSSTATTDDDEFNEDDIFTTDFSRTPPSTSSTPPNHHSNPYSPQNKSNFKNPETSGILAALPEPSNLHHRFYQKTSISTSVSPTASTSSSLSSARMIPSIPKPSQERIPFPSVSSGPEKHHQSAPMNVPVFSKSMMRRREFDDVDLDDYEEEEEMLPPHEIVARSMAQSPVLSSSVLEGQGRTLKGRDLRQVRNAVWRTIGFLD